VLVHCAELHQYIQWANRRDVLRRQKYDTAVGAIPRDPVECGRWRHKLDAHMKLMEQLLMTDAVAATLCQGHAEVVAEMMATYDAMVASDTLPVLQMHLPGV
jgi:hypothetical protein